MCHNSCAGCMKNACMQRRYEEKQNRIYRPDGVKYVLEYTWSSLYTYSSRIDELKKDDHDNLAFVI